MPPAAPPKAPKNLLTTAIQQTLVSLVWTDRANNETGYEVAYGPADQPSSTWASQPLMPNQRAWTAVDLEPGTRYAFRVRAENAAGASEWSNVVEAETLPEPKQGPIARFSVAPDAPRAGEVVTADLRGSYDPDGALVRGGIEWGDGSRTTWDGPPGVIEHTYTADGDFALVAEIEDEDGMRGSLTARLIVMPPVPLPPPEPVPVPPPPGPPPSVSPTGGEPMFIWTPTWQGRMNQMKLDYEANPTSPATMGGRYYKMIRDKALAGTSYADDGWWATLMYQSTGDLQYVERAWTKISAWLALTDAKAGDVNDWREDGLAKVIMADWLWPGLSAARRTQFLNKLCSATRYVCMLSSSGLRTGDSDVIVGIWGTALLLYTRFPEHPTAQELFNLPKSGGYTATASNLTSTYRNAIKFYVEVMGEGGDWMEGSFYNNGTVKLLCTLHHALRSALGVDHFPEIAAWQPLWAKSLIAYWEPGLRHAWQWGDEQFPHETRKYPWTTQLMTLSGILEGTLIGQQCQQLFLDLVTKHGQLGYLTMEPIVGGARGFWEFNPYATAAEWRTAANRSFVAPGMGIIVHRGGYTPTDSLSTIHAANRPQGVGIDHHVEYLNNFSTWMNGEWVQTHTLAYAGPSYTGLGTNAVLFHGQSECAGYKQTGGQEVGTDFAYQVVTTGASILSQPYFDPPPNFCQEWTRTVLQFPGAVHTTLVYDRAHVDPVVPRIERYYPDVKSRMTYFGAIHPKLWVLHMPVTPTIGASDVQWTTPGGQAVRWTPLLPAARTLRLYDALVERQSGTNPYWAATISIYDSELKKYMFLHPTASQAYDTFLNVIQYGVAATPSLIQAAGEVEGVAVARNGAPDLFAVFNAKIGPRLAAAAFDASHATVLASVRLRNTGYQVTVPVVASSALGFLCDLNPAKAWTVQVDGGAVTPLTVSSAGLARLTLTGAGNHTVLVA